MEEIKNTGNQNGEEKKQESQEKSLNIVDEAKKIRDEIKAENDRRENLLKEEQRLQAENLLAGSAGGRVEPEPPKEETPAEYAQRILNGKVKNDRGQETRT